MLTRRKLGFGLVALNASGALPRRVLSSDFPFDLSKPEDNVTVFASHMEIYGPG